MKIAITGHRPSKLGNDYNLTSPLTETIRGTIQSFMNYQNSKWSRHDNITQGICGIALGIDTVFAMVCLARYIPLIAAIPCKNHSSKWNLPDVERYNRILAHPLTTTVIVNDEPYKPHFMQLRNQWMVDQLDQPEDKLIAVWDGSKGGTANCLAYANKMGMIEQGRVIRIDPKDPENYYIMKHM